MTTLPAIAILRNKKFDIPNSVFRSKKESCVSHYSFPGPVCSFLRLPNSILNQNNIYFKMQKQMKHRRRRKLHFLSSSCFGADRHGHNKLAVACSVPSRFCNFLTVVSTFSFPPVRTAFCTSLVKQGYNGVLEGLSYFFRIPRRRLLIFLGVGDSLSVRKLRNALLIIFP